MKTRLIEILGITIIVVFGFIWAISGLILSPIWAVVYVLSGYNYFDTLGNVIDFLDVQSSRLL